MTHSKHQHIQKKIYRLADRNALTNKLHYWRFKDFKIAFTNGCFDVLHVGHADYLARAADLANRLIVGLNTDSSVKRLKGDGRPVNNEEARATLLASMSFVDAVVLFEEDTPYNIITSIEPDVLVKGDDYREENIVGADFVQSKGGKVITLPLLEGYSSTGLIEMIKRMQ